MPDLEALLTRWQSAGVLDPVIATRIRAWESEQKHPAGIRWQGIVALILGALLLACGIVLFVSAHWDELGPGMRLLLALAMVGTFHTAGAATRPAFRALSAALHAAGTAATGAAIALVGQIFNIQEHWPAAILLWAIAAIAGWALLHDEAQEILTLLLIPSWMFCELEYATERHIGQEIYLGRFLLVWAVLYLTVFLGSKRKAVLGILFAAGSIAIVIGVVLILDGWRLSWESQSSVPWGRSVWEWAVIAVLPLLIALVRFGKSLVPVAAALVLAIALPWCNHNWTQHYDFGTYQTSVSRTEPTLLTYAVVSSFAIFLIWWGVRQASKALVNLGIVGFGLTIVWFYFSNILDKFGRSLGLIGLGILFLAGGWALEHMRRRLIAEMSPPTASVKITGEAAQ